MDTKTAIREKRLQNKRRRMENWCFQMVRIEAFLIVLSEKAAVAALGLGILFWLWRLRIDPDFHFRRLPYDVPVALFVVISALSVLVSPDRGFSFYNYYNLVGAYLATYLLAGQTIHTEEQLQKVVKALMYSAMIVMLWGFKQYALGEDTSAMNWVDGDAFPGIHQRIFSTLENPNILAGYLGEAIAFSFAFLIAAKRRSDRILIGAFIFALAVCLAMTYARGAFIVVFCVIGVYSVFRDRRALIGIVAVLAIFFMMDPLLLERISSVFTKVDTSSEMRLALWESTAAMIMDHPVLGIGWGAYWLVYHSYDFYINDASVNIFHAHNMYLNYAAETGLFGAMSYFWFFFGTMKTAFISSVEGKGEFSRTACLGAALALVTVALCGLTDDLVFNIPTSMLLWLTASLVAVAGDATPKISVRRMRR